MVQGIYVVEGLHLVQGIYVEQRLHVEPLGAVVEYLESDCDPVGYAGSDRIVGAQPVM